MNDNDDQTDAAKKAAGKIRITHYPVGVPALRQPPFVQIEYREDDATETAHVEIPLWVWDQALRDGRRAGYEALATTIRDFDITVTVSYQNAEDCALVDATDYQRGMSYAAELYRALAGREEGSEK